MWWGRKHASEKGQPGPNYLNPRSESKAETCCVENEGGFYLRNLAHDQLPKEQHTHPAGHSVISASEIVVQTSMHPYIVPRLSEGSTRSNGNTAVRRHEA